MDHLIAACFAVGFPALTAPSYARRRAAILRGDRALKRREYGETIAWLTTMGVASVAFFLATGLPLARLGLGWPRPAFATGATGFAVVASLLLWLQLRAVRNDPATRAAAREALAPVREYFPSDGAERRLFVGVSFAAGIGEELFYRGFLFWYLAQWLPVWAVLVASSVAFGVAHVMHGAQATIRSTATGFVLGGLYLAGGSLLAPMILHTAIDLTSGATGAIAFADEGAA